VAAAVALALTGTGVGVAWRAGSVSDRRSDSQPPVAHAPASPAAAQPAAPRVDRYGDPLPEGAITRIGTNRFVLWGFASAFSPNGWLIAVSGENYPLRVWEAATGKRVFERQLNPDPMYHTPVTELAFSADSRLLAVSSIWYESIALWDIATGRLLQTIPNTAPDQKQWSRKAQGPTLVFPPDGRTLLAAGKDGGLLVWDLAAGREIARLRASDKPALALTVTRDARTALTAHDGGELHLWDVTNRRHLRRLDVQPRGPHTVTLAPDGHSFAFCPSPNEVEVRDTETGTLRQRFQGDGTVVGLTYAPDGIALWVARAGGEIAAWDVRTGERRRALTCPDVRLPSRPPTEVSNIWVWFGPETREVAWNGLGGVRIWDLTTGRETPVLAGHRTGVSWVGFAADGATLLTAGGGSTFGAWDAATGLERQPLRTLGSSPHLKGLVETRGQIAGDRRRVALVTYNNSIEVKPQPDEGQIFLWDPASDRPPIPLAEQAGPVHFAALTPDSRFVAGTEAGGKIRVYDAATGRLVRTFAGRPYEFHPTFTPDGTILATTAADRTGVRLYDFQTGRVLRDVRDPAHAVSLAFSSDGQYLAIGYDSGPEGGSQRSIVFHHIASAQECGRISTGGHSVHALTFSPDGRLLVSSGYGGLAMSVQLWEVASGQERRRFTGGHSNSIMTLDFAPDGRRFASGSFDCTALVWQVFDPGPTDPTEAELAAKWDDLAGTAVAAHRAVGAFLSAKGGVPFLARQLAPAAAVPADRLAQLIADLDNPRFAARADAEKELARLDDLAAAALRQALTNNPSLEVRQRIDKLLQAVGWPLTDADLLRQLRAIEALEHTGTADARQLLRRLADGVPGARLTREAQASLDRLNRQR
jgi:WD40 repeat protein